MIRKLAGAVFALLILAGGVLAFDVLGTVKKVDADKGILYVHANGQDRQVPIAKDAKVLDKDGKDLKDGLRSKELKEGTEVTITVERANGGPVIQAIRLGKHVAGGGGGRPAQPPQPPPPPRESTGLKPLTEMTASDKYKGEDGGLYGGGKNEPPPEQQAAARKETEQIVPRDAAGKPSKDGKIVLVSISMSNATQEFSKFKQIADRDSDKSPQLTVVDCAQGGMTMFRWAQLDGERTPWPTAMQRLKAAGVTPEQVQIAWVKLANAGPRGELSEHGKQLQKDTIATLHNLKQRFPNLRIAYLGSRIYAGYATTGLNPEPYAYEGAFVVRWLIRDQIKGDPELNHDPAKGAVKAPLLLWGPYFWGDGMKPRVADKLIWERKDLAGDGTHPTQSGQEKVANMLLSFFKTDPNARTWFVKK
jgi:hypothetical protein